MVNHRKWPQGLIYVDLFAGPGICQIEESDERIPGSPLIAAHAPKPFRRILLCEEVPGLAAACETRLRRTDARNRFQMFVGDCNERVRDLVEAIPTAALTLAFVDPTGLHAHFDTLRVLSECGRVDLLILFADAYDIVRNVELYCRTPNSNLDRFLGPDSNWRDKWRALPKHDGNSVRRFFAKLYKRQLEKHLGYHKFGEERMTCARGVIYRLIYASKHATGLDFWDKITKKQRGGQKRMF